MLAEANLLYVFYLLPLGEISHMGTIRSYRMKSSRTCRTLKPFREGENSILANRAF
jgi:hypothetical protein